MKFTGTSTAPSRASAKRSAAKPCELRASTATRSPWATPSACRPAASRDDHRIELAPRSRRCRRSGSRVWPAAWRRCGATGRQGSGGERRGSWSISGGMPGTVGRAPPRELRDSPSGRCCRPPELRLRGRRSSRTLADDFDATPVSSGCNDLRPRLPCCVATQAPGLGCRRGAGDRIGSRRAGRVCRCRRVARQARCAAGLVCQQSVQTAAAAAGSAGRRRPEGRGLRGGRAAVQHHRPGAAGPRALVRRADPASQRQAMPGAWRQRNDVADGRSQVRAAGRQRACSGLCIPGSQRRPRLCARADGGRERAERRPRPGGARSGAARRQAQLPARVVRLCVRHDGVHGHAGVPVDAGSRQGRLHHHRHRRRRQAGLRGWRARHGRAQRDALLPGGGGLRRVIVGGRPPNGRKSACKTGLPPPNDMRCSCTRWGATST